MNDIHPGDLALCGAIFTSPRKSAKRVTKMAEHTIKISLPDGWRPAPGEQPRRCHANEFWLSDNGRPLQCNYGDTYDKCIIIERDPCHIDTTTIEYRLEVYRQWLLGQKIEYKDRDCQKWDRTGKYPGWRWNLYEYRVAPTGHDDTGPYYESEGKRVYVPK